MSDRLVTVTKLERDTDGYWRARVTGQDGITVNVNRKYGSWLGEQPAEAKGKSYLRELAPGVAAALQERVLPLEKAERVEAERKKVRFTRSRGIETDKPPTPGIVVPPLPPKPKPERDGSGRSRADVEAEGVENARKRAEKDREVQPEPEPEPEPLPAGLTEAGRKALEALRAA